MTTTKKEKKYQGKKFHVSFSTEKKNFFWVSQVAFVFLFPAFSFNENTPGERKKGKSNQSTDLEILAIAETDLHLTYRLTIE